MQSRITCTRRLTFEAGHRVMGHESKCASLHGHSYKAEIQAEADLDSLGRVIDFSVLKDRVGGWIDAHWDHAFLVYQEDAATVALMKQTPGQKLSVLPVNPTAENLAVYLLCDVCPVVLSGLGVTVTSVIIHETENCRAEATL